jgi:hypothetical protein
MKRLGASAPLKRGHHKFKEQFIGGEFIQFAAEDQLAKAHARSLYDRVRTAAPMTEKGVHAGLPDVSDQFVNDIRTWSNDQLTATILVQMRQPKCFSWRHK